VAAAKAALLTLSFAVLTAVLRFWRKMHPPGRDGMAQAAGAGARERLVEWLNADVARRGGAAAVAAAAAAAAAPVAGPGAPARCIRLVVMAVGDGSAFPDIWGELMSGGTLAAALTAGGYAGIAVSAYDLEPEQADGGRGRAPVPVTFDVPAHCAMPAKTVTVGGVNTYNRVDGVPKGSAHVVIDLRSMFDDVTATAKADDAVSLLVKPSPDGAVPGGVLVCGVLRNQAVNLALWDAKAYVRRDLVDEAVVPVAYQTGATGRAGAIVNQVWLYNAGPGPAAGAADPAGHINALRERVLTLRMPAAPLQGGAPGCAAPTAGAPGGAPAAGAAGAPGGAPAAGAAGAPGGAPAAGAAGAPGGAPAAGAAGAAGGGDGASSSAAAVPPPPPASLPPPSAASLAASLAAHECTGAPCDGFPELCPRWRRTRRPCTRC
jgi:hypothetical protein